MHCTNCGQSILPDTRFCPSCGNPVARGTASGAAAAYVVRPALSRPRHGRMAAGVCAAFARTYGWNVTLLRIIVVVATLHLAIGLLAYVIAWILIPEEPYLIPSATPPPPATS